MSTVNQRLRGQRTRATVDHPYPLQRAPRHGESPAEAITTAVRSGGQALDASARAFLESGFGHDFGRVRIHADAQADALAATLDAAAFTTGQNIFFRAGHYMPASPAGRRLLAHEAVHTVQQAAGPVMGTPVAQGVSVSRSDDAFERAADRAADQVSMGGRATALPTPGMIGSAVPTATVAVQRSDDAPYPKSFWDVLTDDAIGAGVDFADAGGVSGMGTVGGLLGPLSVFQGGYDVAEGLFGEGPTDWEKTLVGGGNILSGGVSTGVLAGALPSVAGGTAMTAEGLAAAGAAGGFGAGAAGLAAGGAVLSAGLGGLGLGHLLDWGTGALGGAMSGDDRSLSTRMADRSWGINEWVDEATGNDTLGDIAGFGSLGLQTLGFPAIMGAELLGDAVSGVGSKLGDAASYIGDNTTLDPDEIDWGRTFSPWNW
jgi:hypothetical protein